MSPLKTFAKTNHNDETLSIYLIDKSCRGITWLAYVISHVNIT